MKESLVEKGFLVLVNLSEKKSQSGWQHFFESHEKEIRFQKESALQIVRPATVSLNHENCVLE